MVRENPEVTFPDGQKLSILGFRFALDKWSLNLWSIKFGTQNRIQLHLKCKAIYPKRLSELSKDKVISIYENSFALSNAEELKAQAGN